MSPGDPWESRSMCVDPDAARPPSGSAKLVYKRSRRNPPTFRCSSLGPRSSLRATACATWSEAARPKRDSQALGMGSLLTMTRREPGDEVLPWP